MGNTNKHKHNTVNRNISEKKSKKRSCLKNETDRKFHFKTASIKGTFSVSQKNRSKVHFDYVLAKKRPNLFEN